MIFLLLLKVIPEAFSCAKCHVYWYIDLQDPISLIIRQLPILNVNCKLTFAFFAFWPIIPCQLFHVSMMVEAMHVSYWKWEWELGMGFDNILLIATISQKIIVNIIDFKVIYNVHINNSVGNNKKEIYLLLFLFYSVLTCPAMLYLLFCQLSAPLHFPSHFLYCPFPVSIEAYISLSHLNDF